MSLIDQMLGAPVASFIFIITLITSYMAFNDYNLKGKFMFNPFAVVHHKQYERLFTHGLIHADTMHLLFNMLAFYFFAFYLESILGHWQFAVLYILSIPLSSLTTLFKYKDFSGYNSLGASGAVSAVVLSFIMFNPEAKLGLLLLPGVNIPGWVFGLLYLAYSQYMAKRASDNIGHEAHLWGAVAGIVLTLVLKPEVIQILKAWFDGKFM